MIDIQEDIPESIDDQNFKEFIRQINSKSSEDQAFEEFDEPVESIFERITALKEIFPENFFDNVGSFLSTVFNVFCDASWIFFSSGIILLGPIIFEHERLRLTENLNDDEKKSEK